MKSNFVDRTGKASGFNVADEIERLLTDAGMRPKKKIPRSTLNRLLSAEAFRNRVGFTINKGKFELTHQEPVVLSALRRISDDFANRRIVLGDVWDVDGKRAYLDQLEAEKVLPTAHHAVTKPKSTAAAHSPSSRTKAPPQTTAQRPSRRIYLIPNTNFPIAWAGRIQRHRAIWEELQFRLQLTEHPNAISVLLRVLLELSIENYLRQTPLIAVKENDTLAKRALRVAEDLHSKGKIDNRYFDVFKKFPQYDALVSADTLNRYVHSPNFAPSPEHLTAL